MQYAPLADRTASVYELATSTPGEVSAWSETWLDAERLDVSRRVLTGRIQVGQTNYHLRSSFVGYFCPGRHGSNGEFSVQGFAPLIVGHGENVDDAYLDWRDQLHCRFQKLYTKRPFEMTEEERKSWREFERHIDVAIYRNTTPLSIKQVGKVGAHARPRPDLIEWEDGHKEKVRLEQMPAEFVTYCPGQMFEAVVNRDPVDFHLIDVAHVRRIRPLSRMGPEEFDDLINRIPTTGSLPTTDWD